MTTFRVFCAATALVCVFAKGAPAADESFDAETGFRIAHYRGAVPDTVPGGTRINLEKLDALVKSGAVLLDVMPSEGAGADPETGEWRLSRTHQSIPGSTWLPDVGRGKITPALGAYLASNLKNLTDGDKTKAVILFCQSDCWMAWNAVQRASKLGYAALYWFPEGTDGWVEWGDRKLENAAPVPLKPGK